MFINFSVRQNIFLALVFDTYTYRNVCRSILLLEYSIVSSLSSIENFCFFRKYLSSQAKLPLHSSIDIFHLDISTSNKIRYYFVTYLHSFFIFRPIQVSPFSRLILDIRIVRVSSYSILQLVISIYSPQAPAPRFSPSETLVQAFILGYQREHINLHRPFYRLVSVQRTLYLFRKISQYQPIILDNIGLP